MQNASWVASIRFRANSQGQLSANIEVCNATPWEVCTWQLPNPHFEENGWSCGLEFLPSCSHGVTSCSRTLNFRLISKYSEDTATENTENCVFNHALSFDVQSPTIPCKYLHNPNIAENYTPWMGYIFAADSMYVCIVISFHVNVSERPKERTVYIATPKHILR